MVSRSLKEKNMYLTFTEAGRQEAEKNNWISHEFHLKTV